MYRNKEFYLMILKGKTMDWAYHYITENLKSPSFVYEPQNAYAAYKEVFGVDFASPEQMQALSDKEEIERLKRELEKANLAKCNAGSQIKRETWGKAPNGDGGSNPSPGENGDPITTKGQFLAANPELKGLPGHRAWLKYAKEHGLEK